MKHKAAITSVVLAGSLALGAGLAFSQSGSESRKPGGSVPGATQPGEYGGDVNRQPGQSDMGKQHGSSGMDFSSEEIKQVQQALKDRGHDPGSATGVINDDTRQAIRDFQKANDLSVTGTLDRETAQKLGVSVGESSIGGGTMPGSSGSESRSPYGSGSIQSPDLGFGSTGSGSNK